jgi:Beta-propeller repeat
MKRKIIGIVVCILLIATCVLPNISGKTPWSWAKHAGGTTYDRGYATCIDSSGNIYITGYFENTVSFGSIVLTSFGARDVFVAKLDSSGNWLWAVNPGGVGYYFGTDISVDSNGDIYITGEFNNTDPASFFDLISIGARDVFVAKLNSSGNWLWAVRGGGVKADSGQGISTDSNGDIYVTGYFWKEAWFGSHYVFTFNSYHEAFVAKLDSSGNWLWVNKTNTMANPYPGFAWGEDISVDSNGDIYITGKCSGLTYFGSAGGIVGTLSEVFVAKLNSSGDWLWAKRAGGVDNDIGYAISVDSNGNIYVTGSFETTASFGSGILESMGYSDVFVAKLNSSGNWLSTISGGGTDSDEGYGISVDSTSNIIVTGYFGFTGGSFGSIVLTSFGESDVFVAKLHDNQPPVFGTPSPANGTTYIPRPPAQLEIAVTDLNNDSLDVSFFWINHTGIWVSLQTYTGVGNGIFHFIPPAGNDWIWGNTPYTWSVNVTDGEYWTNETYTYTTGGSRYDVNNNNVVNFQDAGLVWVHRASLVPYDGLYDVNQDSQVNFQDAGLTWVNRN